MARGLATILLAGTVVGVSSSAAVPKDVIDGYFPDRSAEVIFKQVNHSPPDAEVVLVDQAGLVHKGNEDSLRAHNLADVVARGLGVQPVNDDFNPAFMGGTSFFHKPKANLMLSLESVGSATLATTNLPNFLALTQQTDVSPVKGANLEVLSLTDISYPNHPISLAATLATGTKPFQHGIVGKEWLSKTGSKKIAYKGASSSLTANVADLVSQSFGGESLIVSFSGDEQLAAAFCVHPKLSASTKNSHCLALGETEEKLFDKSVTLNRDSLIKVMSSTGKSSVLAALQAQPSDSALSLSYDPQGVVFVGFEDKAGTKQKTSFDLHLDADRKFWNELQSTHTLSRALGSPQAASLVQDDVPDMYSVSLTGYTSLIEKYGRSSMEAVAALHILDRAVPMFLQKFSSHYPGRFFSQVVLMGAHPSTKVSADKRSLLDKVATLVPDNNIAETFPSMFFRSDNSAHVCTSIAVALQNSAYRAICPSLLAKKDEVTQPRFLRAEAPSPAKKRAAAEAPTYTLTSDEVTTYQIVLWLSILMSFVLFFTITSLCCMDFKKDPLLYSTYNPKWENRKNK